MGWGASYIPKADASGGYTGPDTPLPPPGSTEAETEDFARRYATVPAAGAKPKGGHWGESYLPGGPNTGGEVTATPTWSQYLTEGAKTAGQHMAKEAGFLGPMAAGAAMGGALGGPPGAVVGAGIGGFASPTGEHLASQAVGLPTQPPTYEQAGQGARAGAMSEMGGPIAEKLVAEPLMRIGGKLWRAVTGANEIGAAATAAGAGAEAANVAEREKLQGKATTEAGGQKKATADAATAAGQAQMSDIEKRHQAIVAAQENAKQTQLTEQVKAGKTVDAARKQFTQEAEPQARQEVLEGALHPAGAGPMAAGPERIQRGEQFRESIVGRLQRYHADWRARRDAAIGKFGKDPVDGQPLQEEMANEVSKWPPGHAPYSPRVQKLFQKIGGMFKADPEEIAAKTGEVLTSPTGYSVKADNTWSKVTGQLSRMSPEQRASFLADQPPAQRQFLEQQLQQSGAVPKQPTVNEYLALQSEANAIARASKGADRTAALRAVHGVDKTLAGVDLPGLKAINAEYRDHRLHFPFAFEDAIQNAPNPLAAAKDIFSQPERVLDLAKFGTPEENGQLAQYYSDYVREEGKPVLDPKVFRALGFKGPMADPKSWIYADKATERVGEMFDSAPQAKAKFDASLSEAESQAKDEYAKSVLKDARADLRKMGLTGVRIQGQIDAAPTLQDKATIAIKTLSGLDPASEAIKGVTTEQGNTMGQAASGAATMAPHGARQALAEFQPQDPHEAEVKAVQQFVSPQSFMKRWKRRAEFWAPLVAGTAATGRPSSYAMMGLAMGPPLAVRESLVAAYRRSLQDPGAANAFLWGLKNPGTRKGLQTLTRYVAQAAIFKNMPQDPPEPEKPTPAKAEPFLPPAPVKPEARADLRGKLKHGKSPDVTHDLRSGHLKPHDIHAELSRKSGDMTS